MTEHGWVTSAESDQVLAAWVAALQSIEDVRRDSRVTAGPMKYSYATLAAVLDEVRPKLAAHDLVLSQPVFGDGIVSTIVFHKSGQWINFPAFRIEPVGRTPQQVGSAVSYARRYSILSICGIATEDDDGASASVGAGPPAEAEPRPEFDQAIVDRVNKVLGQLKDLDEDGKARVKTWADGRSMAGFVMLNNPDWLSEVEAFLDEGLGVDDDDDMPDEDEKPEDPV